MISWTLKLIALALLVLAAVLSYLNTKILTKLVNDQEPKKNPDQKVPDADCSLTGQKTGLSQQKFDNERADLRAPAASGALDIMSMPLSSYVIDNKKVKATGKKVVSRKMTSLKNIIKVKLLKIKGLTNGKKLV